MDTINGREMDQIEARSKSIPRTYDESVLDGFRGRQWCGGGEEEDNGDCQRHGGRGCVGEAPDPALHARPGCFLCSVKFFNGMLQLALKAFQGIPVCRSSTIAAWHVKWPDHRFFAT
jgi:hypothetical protein